MADNDDLCQSCKGINIEALRQDGGYIHAASDNELYSSSETCPMCKLIHDSLRGSNDKSSDDPNPPDTTVVCRLMHSEGTQAVVHVKTGARKGYIRIYVSKMDDPAANFGVLTKPKMDVETLAGLSDLITKAALMQCLQEHKCTDPYRRPEAGPDLATGQGSEDKRGTPLDMLPSRLIALQAFGEDEAADACLVDIPPGSKEPGDPGFYAALSYCWGRNVDALYKTETATLKDRQERIRFDELPKTFQDAIRITRRLGLPYIWIDAICIIQDSARDWEQESAKMGGIYASGTLTIAADISEGVEGGILDLEFDDALEHPGSVRITSTLSDGKESSLVFYHSYNSPPGTTWTPPVIADSPLSRRAWCMQERMLSPRTLHFTKQGPVWECRDKYFIYARTSTFDEMSDIKTFASVPRLLCKGLSTEGQMLKMPALEAMGSDPNSLSDEHIELINTMWETGMQKNWRDPPAKHADGDRIPERSDEQQQAQFVAWWNRNVVVPFSERLLTYASDRLPAVSGIAKLFAEHIKAPYAAGVWLAGLDESLEWTRAGTTFHDTKLPGFPSFSWASHPGPVRWPYQIDLRGYGQGFEVVGHEVKLSGLDPHGRTESAELTLRGHLRHANFGANIEDKQGGISGIVLDGEGKTIGKMELDFMPDDEQRAQGAEVFLLYKNSIGFLRLLLLSPVSVEGDPIPRAYRRIGIGMINRKDAAWLEGTEKTLVKLI
ncbi:uncharacterized protein E0L32_010189 [Thyridium curvatum]|uniref:Heterokaryon incompatibility domain-containing protein n=1 Tax=Thyridium curvatum TaxID=1093900 RepID=A0A507AGU7_9PEZI|nr:uncharacterized protein E0L32_010189 [Thyridium curvatum]TPX08122.1 hypothetical protein E0L32_010189 [Thyridium curvatum]